MEPLPPTIYPTFKNKLIMQTQTLDAFQVIADPSRRAMLHLLSKDSLTINALADNFDMSRPAVSKHIKILSMAGFITIEDVGRERHCTLKQDGFNELHKWINYYDNFWSNKLRKLESILNNKPKKIKNHGK
jgi:DNA-binding transcriptional ArsR family regulator